MTEEKWKQIRRLVDKAIDIPQPKRKAYLDEACSGKPEVREEVESLLAMEDPAKDFIETPVVSRKEVDKELLSSAEKRERIGRYEVIREIGRGGMARVYEAKRDDDLKMKVAIKVIKTRFQNREEVNWRFRHERRILAGLDHPNIAKLIDGGTTEDDGLPYFVMEHVEGEQLDEYCDNRKLSTAERVKLFRKVCSAVEYAHRKLIVHRDLKPSNILVTNDGEPKLLDFGIAKLLETEPGSPRDTTALVTIPGIQPMTPGYASPEQFKGETITIATDVYSLGVVLYELLTGHNPHCVSDPVYERFRQAAIEEDPTKPSEIVGQSKVVWTPRETQAELTPERVSKTRQRTWKELKRRLTGDLDSIALKALRKKPEQRYRSISALSEDLERCLKGLPVAARRGDFSYRVFKFIKIHRWRMALVSLLALVLISFSYHSWRVSQLEEQEKLILQERDRVIVTLVAAIAGNYKDGTFQDKLHELASGEIEGVLERLNDLALSLEKKQGDYQTAEGIYRALLELKIEKFGENSSSVSVGLGNLAANLTVQGKYEEAEGLYKDALVLKERLHGRKSEKTVPVLNNLAAFYQNIGELDRADELLEEIFVIRDEVLDADDPRYLSATNNHGFSLQLRGQYAEAEAVYRDVLERVRPLGIPLREASILRNLAEVLRGQGELEEAEEVAQEARRLAYGASINWRVADIESVLGGVLMDLGHVEEAGPLLSRGYEATKKRLGGNARQTVEAQERLSAWLEATGN